MARRRQFNAELDAEMRAHLEMRIQANLEAGMSPEEARRQAGCQFGGIEAAQEACREQNGVRWLEDFIRDVTVGVRTLARDRKFALSAGLILALAIGLNTAIFSIASPVMFRVLPFPQPHELVFLNESNPKQGFDQLSISYADFQDWRAQNRTLAGLGLFAAASYNLSGAGVAEKVSGQRISSGLFAALGIQPVMGRHFLDGEDQPGAAPVVMLSHGLWQRRFGADRNMVGQAITLNGLAHTVVGIMPPGFGFPERSELWTPLVVNNPGQNRGSHSYMGVGRMKPGVTLAQVREDLRRVHERLAQEHPAECANVSALVMPLREQWVGGVQTTGWLMLAAAGFVLVVACANVGNLFLARALGRHKEFAIRASLGAGRGRLIRQLLAESWLLAVFGGGLGLFSAWGIQKLLFRLLPTSDLPYWIQFTLGWRELAFAVVVTLVACGLFGLAPSWQVVRSGTPVGMPSQPHTSSAHRNRLRNWLIASEVALAMMLLSGAGVMWKTLLNLEQAKPGFNPGGLAFCYLDLPSTHYSQPQEVIQFYAALLEKLRAAPGMASAAVVSAPPMGGNNNGFSYVIEGRPVAPAGEIAVGNARISSPGYFATMGIPLLQGRDFTEADEASGHLVIIIDATMARQCFAGQNPLGQRINTSGNPNDPSSWREIVGVAGEVKHYGLDQDIRPGFYIPHRQMAYGSMAVVWRTTNGNPLLALPALRQVVADLDPMLAVARPVAMPDRIRRTFWLKRLLGQLFGGFSLLAMTLAMAGIAGVALYIVAQRTHEIGVRMALGAPRHRVILLVLRQGLPPVLTGLALGLAASMGVNRLLQSQLYQVSATDPVILAGSVLALGGVALLACYWPARRATRINPMEALRAE